MTTSAAGVSSGSFWKPLTPFLQRAHPTVITGYCSLVTFLCYFSLYGLKKPFTAASYDEYEWLAGIQLKTALALSQLAGYIFAKFVGIKIVFEVDREGPARAFYLIGLAVMALVGWIIHALVPIQWKVIGVFLTGIPMGLVWGIAITYVEGRSGTDFIIAILSSAYIVASGVVKDVGLDILLSWKVPKFWMPAVAAVIFFFPYTFAVWGLHQIPPPSQRDIAMKVARKKMMAADRTKFLKEFWPGIVAIIIADFFLYAYRDFRDTFGAELLKGMGETLQAGVFSKCELAVGAGVTIIVASMVMIQSNFLGFAANVVLIFSGFMLAAGTVALYDFFHIPAIPFMILSGVAAFASVVPLGAPFWERLIAFLAIEDVTSAYPIQLAGALGCMGTVTVFLIQAVGVPWDHLQFYRYFSYFLAIVSGMATIFAGVYFAIYKPKRLKRSRSAQQWIEDLEAEQVAAGTATTSTSISFKKHDTITK